MKRPPCRLAGDTIAYAIGFRIGYRHDTIHALDGIYRQSDVGIWFVMVQMDDMGTLHPCGTPVKVIIGTNDL